MPEENIYTSMYSRNAELYHHGILGQKWGIQNGPPYPLSKEESNRIKKEAKQNVKDARKELRNTYIGKRMVGGAVAGTILGGPLAGVVVAYGMKWLTNTLDQYAKTQYEEAARKVDNAKSAKRTVQHIIDESKATEKDLNKKSTSKFSESKPKMSSSTKAKQDALFKWAEDHDNFNVKSLPKSLKEEFRKGIYEDMYKDKYSSYREFISDPNSTFNDKYFDDYLEEVVY